MFVVRVSPTICQDMTQFVTNSVITLLLVEDYALIRAGMRALINYLPDIQVVAEARDGREALALIEHCRPHIVLMDLALPLIDGHQATAVISQRYPEVRVIILSMYTEQEDVVQALQAGAVGFVPKFASDVELKQAIDAVIAGQTYLSPHVSHHLAAYVRQEETEPRLAGPPPPLTLRQQEVLRLIANGRSTKEIATTLNISIKTAEAHRANIMERLNIRDVAGLVRYALRTGLVEA